MPSKNSFALKMLRQRNAKAKNDVSPALGLGNFNQENKRSVADPILLITATSSPSARSPAATMMITSFALVMVLSYSPVSSWITRIFPFVSGTLETFRAGH